MSLFAWLQVGILAVDCITLKLLKVLLQLFPGFESFIHHLQTMQQDYFEPQYDQKAQLFFLNQKLFIIPQWLQLRFRMILKCHSVKQESDAKEPT